MRLPNNKSKVSLDYFNKIKAAVDSGDSYKFRNIVDKIKNSDSTNKVFELLKYDFWRDFSKMLYKKVPYENLTILSFLLECGADTSFWLSQHHSTVLHRALTHGRKDFFKYILENNFFIDWISLLERKNKCGTNSLTVAKKKGFFEIENIIKKGIKIQQNNYNNKN